MSENGSLVLMIVLSLVERIIFGCITAKINRCKGRDGGFAWGFFLCGIGIIVTATRRSLIDNTPYTPAYANPASFLEKETPAAQAPVKAEKTWKCVKCGHENALDCAFCTECGERRRNKWTCEKCGKENAADAQFCPSCGNAWSEEQEKSASNASDGEEFVEYLRTLSNAAEIAAAFEEKFAGSDNEDAIAMIAALKKVSQSERSYGNMKSLAIQRAEAYYKHGMKLYTVNRSNPTLSCPVCGKMQRNDRATCFGCGALFRD